MVCFPVQISYCIRAKLWVVEALAINLLWQLLLCSCDDKANAIHPNGAPITPTDPESVRVMAIFLT
jgi:hypothetical protein